MFTRRMGYCNCSNPPQKTPQIKTHVSFQKNKVSAEQVHQVPNRCTKCWFVCGSSMRSTRPLQSTQVKLLQQGGEALSNYRAISSADGGAAGEGAAGGGAAGGGAAWAAASGRGSGGGVIGLVAPSASSSSSSSGGGGGGGPAAVGDGDGDAVNGFSRLSDAASVGLLLPAPNGNADGTPFSSACWASSSADVDSCVSWSSAASAISAAATFAAANVASAITASSASRRGEHLRR